MTEELQDEDNPIDNKERMGLIVEEAMMVLVSTYANIPHEELDETPVAVNAGSLCEVLELFMAYIGRYEDFDLDHMMQAADMEMQATYLDYDEDTQIH